MKNLKFILSLLLIFVFVSTPAMAGGNNITIYIDNEEVSVREVPIIMDGQAVYSDKGTPTFISKGSTYVPIRFVAEHYGLDVTWNGKTKEVKLTDGSKNIVMTINSSKVLVDGKAMTIENNASPKLVRAKGERNSSTMVPLAFISKTLGYEVDYNPSKGLPIINSNKGSDNTKPNTNKAITSISLVKGSTDLSKLNIKSTEKMSFSHKKTGNKISLVINNMGLKDDKLSNIKLSGKPIKSVTTKQVGKNLEIGIDLTENYDYDIREYNGGKEITVSPVSKIGSIKKETIDGRDAVVIYRTKATKLNRMSLSNPKRFVLDIMDSVVGYDYKELNIKTGSISNVRVSQYSPDKSYNTKDRITRVVLDMTSEKSDIEVKEYEDKIVVRENIKATDKPEEKPTNPKPVDPKPSKPKPNPGKKTIVIDAGHGGHDSGATSGGTKEKDIALAVSKKVEGILKGKGFNVIMTRDDDTYVSLGGRSKMANDANADLFVSIHANSFTGEAANGIETLHSGSNSSKKLSQGIQDELIKETGATDRGIKHRPNLAVLRGTKMPASLVELGFITNPNERAKLNNNSYQNKLAQAIARGIENYFK